MVLRTPAIIIGSILVLIGLPILFGSMTWRAESTRVQKALLVNRFAGSTEEYSPSQIQSVPEPVRRYLASVLENGQPIIRTATIAHSGTLNMGSVQENWRPFSSVQHVATDHPGFIWDARVKMMPGIEARVRDAYVKSQGILTAKVFGLFTVMDQPPTLQLAQGELIRFLAETAWYPTYFIQDRNLIFDPISDRSVSVTINDDGVSAKLLFEFSEDGFISAVKSEGRYRTDDGVMNLSPWEGRFWNYERRDGIMIPLDGEVSWIIDGEAKPYWRGTIQEIDYQYD